MILTKKDLRKWQESTFTPVSAEQSRTILERFGAEPEPYEWSEQDISIQIQNYLSCGEFEKTMRRSGEGITLLPGIEF